MLLKLGRLGKALCPFILAPTDLIELASSYFKKFQERLDVGQGKLELLRWRYPHMPGTHRLGPALELKLRKAPMLLELCGLKNNPASEYSAPKLGAGESPFHEIS